MSLAGHTIIITGASSGIGRQCAISCSKDGANVILIARNEARLRSVLNELETGSHAYYIFDLLEFDLYNEFLNSLVEKHGRISGFIHSAGIEATIPLNTLKPQIYQNIFEVNVISCFEIIRILSKKKNTQPNASFVVISSIMGVSGQKGKLAYCSSKAALINGVKALALELAQKGIRVNCVSPGIVKTPMVDQLFSSISEESKAEIIREHPLGLGEPNDVANACIYLLSDASKWMTGSNLIIDGGYSAQ